MTGVLTITAIFAIAFAGAMFYARPRPNPAPAVLAGDDAGRHHADQVDEPGPGRRYRGIHRPGGQQPGQHETGWPAPNLIGDTAEIDADVLRRLVDGDATTEVTP